MDDRSFWAWLVGSLELGIGAALVVANLETAGAMAVAMGLWMLTWAGGRRS